MYVLQEAIELLWNMLEQTTPGASGPPAPGNDAVTLTAAHLLEKHRALSAAHVLGTAADVAFLWELASGMAMRCFTEADKQLRNDVVVVLTLIARRHDNRPLFLTPTGVLADVLSVVSAPELLGPHERLQYGTHSAVDFEFKALLWGLALQVCA